MTEEEADPSDQVGWFPRCSVCRLYETSPERYVDFEFWGRKVQGHFWASHNAGINPWQTPRAVGPPGERAIGD